MMLNQLLPEYRGYLGVDMMIYSDEENVSDEDKTLLSSLIERLCIYFSLYFLIFVI